MTIIGKQIKTELETGEPNFQLFAIYLQYKPKYHICHGCAESTVYPSRFQNDAEQRLNTAEENHNSKASKLPTQYKCVWGKKTHFFGNFRQFPKPHN
jgi:hypothetical protein